MSIEREDSDLGALREELDRLRLEEGAGARARSEMVREVSRVALGAWPYRRILVVDDDPAFRDGLLQEASNLRLRDRAHFEVSAIDAACAADVLSAIRAGIERKEPYDLLILDYLLRENEFTADDVLRALNESDDPAIRFLPRMAITSHYSKGETLTAQLLGMGADGVHLYKGSALGESVDANTTSYEQILTALFLSEFLEMQVRAWGRMWRMIRHRVEEEISKQRVAPCTGFDQYLKQLSAIWRGMYDTLIGSKYASRANLRVCVTDQLKSVDPIDEHLIASGLAVMTWDHLPYYESWLTKATGDYKSIIDRLTVEFESFKFDDLSRQQLGGDQRLDRLLLGRRVIGMPLFTHHGPIGAFTLVRESTQTPFAQTDWEQMLTVGLRLASYAQELRERWLEHERQEVLGLIVRAMIPSLTEDELLQYVIRHVHEGMFRHVQGLRGKAQLPRAGALQPGGRSVVRMLQANGQLPGYGLGVGIGPEVGPVDRDRRTTGLLVERCIETSSTFFSCNAHVEPGYKPPVTGSNASVMHAPLLVNGVAVGALAVGHAERGHFGHDEKESADFQFLQRCAILLGDELNRRRETAMQLGALDLLLELSHVGESRKQPSERDPDVGWAHRVATLLARHLLACRAVLWLRPPSDVGMPWPVVAAWEAANNRAQGEPLDVVDAERLASWGQHLARRWSESFAANLVSSDAALIDLSNEHFVVNNVFGIDTKSQLSLRVTLTPGGPTLALLVLLFTVKKPVDLDVQRPLFERLARLSALFLQERESLVQLSSAQVLAQRGKALGDAYQQMRHSLRGQLGSLDEAFKTCLRTLAADHPKSEAISGVAGLHQAWLAFMPGVNRALNASAVITRSLQPSWIEVSKWFKSLMESTRSRSETLGVDLKWQVDEDKFRVELLADSEVLSLVVNNLIENALDEFDFERVSAAGRAARPADASRPHISLLLSRVTTEDDSSARPGAYRWRLVVADNGPGVLPQMLSSLFSGSTNKPNGGGFQLRFCHEKLLEMGMRLRHEANEPRGATFVIEVPPDLVSCTPIDLRP